LQGREGGPGVGAGKYLLGRVAKALRQEFTVGPVDGGQFRVRVLLAPFAQGDCLAQLAQGVQLREARLRFLVALKKGVRGPQHLPQAFHWIAARLAAHRQGQPQQECHGEQGANGAPALANDGGHWSYPFPRWSSNARLIPEVTAKRKSNRPKCAPA